MPFQLKLSPPILPFLASPFAHALVSEVSSCGGGELVTRWPMLMVTLAASTRTPWHGVAARLAAQFGRLPLLPQQPEAAVEHGVLAPGRRHFAVCWRCCWLWMLVRAFFIFFDFLVATVCLSALPATRTTSGDASRRSRSGFCGVLHRHWRGGLGAACRVGRRSAPVRFPPFESPACCCTGIHIVIQAPWRSERWPRISCVDYWRVETQKRAL